MEELRCSFCGKRRQQVSGIVSGPGVAICADCARIAVGLLEEGDGGMTGSSERAPVISDSRSLTDDTPPAQRMGWLRAALDAFPEVDRPVLEHRLGVHDRQPRDVAEVAERFGLSRGHVEALYAQFLDVLMGADATRVRTSVPVAGSRSAPPYFFTNRKGDRYYLFRWLARTPSGTRRERHFFARDEYLQIERYRRATVASLPLGGAVTEDAASGIPEYRQVVRWPGQGRAGNG